MPQKSGSAILSLLSGLFLFVVVLILAWLCTRWLGRRYSFFRQGDRIQILEQKMLGPDRMLLIVRVDGRVWLLGSTNQNIVLLEELEASHFLGEEDGDKQGKLPVMSGTVDFAKTFQTILRRDSQTDNKHTEDKQDD